MRTNRQARKILNLDYWSSNQFKVSVEGEKSTTTKKRTGRKKSA